MKQNLIRNNFKHGNPYDNVANLAQLEESYTRLKNKDLKNNSTWEGAFYQNEWAKINSSWVYFILSHKCIAADT